MAQLKKHHVRQISPRPQTIPISNPAAAGIKAIKFRDLDGHNMELLWFLEGKGNSVWHEPIKGLFLGIDHRAMTVRSTENSIRFYRDLLGLAVAGGTVNVGAEQAYLDSLPGARVRVTGMTAQAGRQAWNFWNMNCRQLAARCRRIPAPPISGTGTSLLRYAMLMSPPDACVPRLLAFQT